MNVERGFVAVFFLLSALSISGCGQVAPLFVEPPRLDITCPDPDQRARLVEGSTYRDLAGSRIEAIEGWQVCHRALDISQDRNETEVETEE